MLTLLSQIRSEMLTPLSQTLMTRGRGRKTPRCQYHGTVVCFFKNRLKIQLSKYHYIVIPEESAPVDYWPPKRVPWRCVHPRSVHPFTFFSVSAVLSTRRGPCKSEALSTARAAPGDHELLIGGARWRSRGELRLGQSVTWTDRGWTDRGWTYRQGTLKNLCTVGT
jgi:hypothetical protein